MRPEKVRGSPMKNRGQGRKPARERPADLSVLTAPGFGRWRQVTPRKDGNKWGE